MEVEITDNRVLVREQWFKRLLELANKCEEISDVNVQYLIGYIQSAEMFLEAEGEWRQTNENK